MRTYYGHISYNYIYEYLCMFMYVCTYLYNYIFMYEKFFYWEVKSKFFQCIIMHFKLHIILHDCYFK